MNTTPLSTAIQAQQRHELLKATILIVDDTDLNRLVMKEMLKEVGFSNLMEAANGQEALDVMNEHQPDLIILDLIMPVMDGYAVCEAVRKDERLTDVPILVQTALSGSEQRIRALSIGASDIISKPTTSDEILARCFIHLERRALMKDLRHYKKQMENELDHARELQKTLLPNAEKLERFASQNHLRVHHHYSPSYHLGGDFWGVINLGDNQVALYTVDLSGHGIYSALNAFRLDALIHSFDQEAAKQPSVMLENLNQSLVTMLPAGHFATMFYGVFTEKNNTLEYATAACPTAMHIQEEGVQCLDGQGFPLGVTAEATYTNKHITMQKKDKLLLYSDALTEVENTQGIMFGEDKLTETIKKIKKQSGKAMLQTLVSTYHDHLGPNTAQDDLTITLYELV
jgi:sigma-B regulation protein RsbU (phosphoserine phosphatase)